MSMERWIETRSIIGDGEMEVGGVVPEVNVNLGCVGVPLDIGERFLCDAEEFVFDRRWELAICSADIEVDDEWHCAGLIDEVSQARGKGVLCGDGAEIPDATTGFGESFANVGAGAVELLASCGGLGMRKELRDQLELDGDSSEALSEGVVDL